MPYERAKVKLFDLPNIISLKKLGEVMILLFLGHLIELSPDGVVVGGSLDITDDTESHWEVRTLHESELKLERVVLAMSVMDKNIVNGDTILTNLDNLEAKALLNEAELLVFTEDERLAVLNIDSVQFTTLTAVD